MRETRGNAEDNPVVNSTLAIAPAESGLKLGLVGREYKWTSERTDVIDVAANATIGKIIDYLAMKDADGLSELVMSIAVASNALYQVLEAEVFYFELSRV